MPDQKMPVAAIVLCGGASRRMGADKAWATLDKSGADSETFLQRICRKLAEVASPIVVVTAPQQKLPSLPSNVYVTSDLHPGEGPLGGFLTGLNAWDAIVQGKLRERPIWLSSCDAPFCDVAVIHLLLSKMAEFDAVVVRANERLHPLAAVYHHRIQKTAQVLFDGGERKMMSLIAASNAQIVDAETLRPADHELRFLRSANTPGELQKVRTAHAGNSGIAQKSDSQRNS